MLTCSPTQVSVEAQGVSPALLTLPGFLIIYAKLSDIFGRKIMLLSALLLFTVFSSACGAAQTLLQLCVQDSSELLHLLIDF